MNLLQLGAQARKTGLKPRSNITKDKYDMEDVDEFFEDTSVPEIRRHDNSFPNKDGGAGALTRNESTALPLTTTRKTLGVGRIRLITRDSSAGKQDHDGPSENKENKTNSEELGGGENEFVYPDYPDFDVVADFDDVDEAPEDTQSESRALTSLSIAEQESNSGNEHPDDLLDDIRNDLEMSPIPLLSLTNKEDTQESLQLPIRNVKSTGSHFTKDMALGKTKQKKRPRIVESDNEELGDVTQDVLENPSSDGGDAFDSDFSENRYSQTSSYKPSQLDIIQPSPLPSPPPEGLRRSKRTRIAPLAYWRNERIVYTRALEASSADPDSTLISDIRKVPLQEIREVVHIPEAKKMKAKTRRGRPPKSTTIVTKGKNAKSAQEAYDYESDPEIEGSEWFKDKSLEAEVFESEDSRVKRVVAWSPDGGTFRGPPAGKSGQTAIENFKVAPLFDSESDVVAAGLLEFPLDGFKSLRTTGESLFIFHVVKGLIEVTLNSDKFVVTRGCSFEVPKLNIYSFKNIGQGSARLFFVQCQIN